MSHRYAPPVYSHARNAARALTRAPSRALTCAPSRALTRALRRAQVVRARAASAVSKLMKLSVKLDPLLNDLVAGARDAESDGVRETMLSAVSVRARAREGH